MIAARVKFLQSSGRIERRQEVLRAVSSARGRNAAEGILSPEIQSTPPTFLAKCISFPTMDCFRKREGREVDDGGGIEVASVIDGRGSRTLAVGL